MKAVILAGGLGTRLQPYTTFLPKSMLPLGEKPLLEHLIDWTRKNGVKSIVLCLSYLRKTIEDYFEDGKNFGVNIEYAVSKRPLATAGQLKTAEKFLKNTFVCMYGDSIFNFKLKEMVKQHQQKKSFITIGLYEYKTNLPYGVIETAKNGKVIAWNEKPEIYANINMGCYVMEPQVFDWIPKNKLYGMDDLVKKAMRKRKAINSFTTKKGFIDIGDKSSYRKANRQYLAKLGKI
ncbi:MAG: nucleotidyltransferase family protein [Thaumarchaeota archaeon]|nr:nucleotidyltransferase family protein [Nitrososphaerota archaeon]